MEVRRADGYGDADGGIAWLFESYASEAVPEDEPETRPPRRRLVPWGR